MQRYYKIVRSTFDTHMNKGFKEIYQRYEKKSKNQTLDQI